MSENSSNGSSTKVFRGIPVAPGYAIGPAHLVDRHHIKVPKYHIDHSELPSELARLQRALDSSDRQIEHVKASLQSAGDEHVLILEAHQLMLRDDMLVGQTKLRIEKDLINADWAVTKVVHELKRTFDAMNDEYFRERRADVDYVGDRILRNLMGSAHPSLSQVTSDSVVVARDLSPADTAFLLRRPVLGFATEVGGKTSHTAIMARSLELPAVVGVERLVDVVGESDMLVIDGCTGRVLLNPSRDELRRYQKLQLGYTAKRAALNQTRYEPARTVDGRDIRVAGNIELGEEADIVLDYGAEGIGLFRTEYLYMNRETLPNEDEQLRQYKMVVERSGSAGATIRTLDLGGDKFITPLKLSRGLNPVMGLRAIRFCLREHGIFKTQLRAMLRASAFGPTRIMVPLISGVEEMLETRAILDECGAELRAEGHAFSDDVPLGAMVELPSAAVTADLLARVADFFAIGTNDLIQYTLAIDRANEHVAHMYRPLHPAMLRMLRTIISAAHEAGIRVSLCGEMAGDALYTPVLLGLGLEEFSMNANSIPIIKSVIRAVDMAACRALVDELMLLDRTAPIQKRVAAWLEDALDGRIPKEVFDPAPFAEDPT